MFSAQQLRCAQQTAGSELRPSGWREQRLRRFADVEPAVARLVAEMEAAGYPEKDQFAVRISLDEAIANALKHGNQLDPSKVVTFRHRVTPETVLAEVEDEGPGFDPGDVPDPTAEENLERPCGRGLFLMRAYMTWVRHNERGNRITLSKYRSLT